MQTMRSLISARCMFSVAACSPARLGVDIMLGDAAAAPSSLLLFALSAIILRYENLLSLKYEIIRVYVERGRRISGIRIVACLLWRCNLISMSTSAHPCLLTLNGGSSSIKFAVFEAGEPLRRVLGGEIERIGLPEATLTVKGTENLTRKVAAPDHTAAVNVMMDWLDERMGTGALVAAGHRVVHGGPRYSAPARITPEMIRYLRELEAFDPEHLPEEIELTEAVLRRLPNLPQFACFDTAFHHEMPQVAQMLPIPRRYAAKGLRRYGFHGLSYAYLMEQLGGRGRFILAHLGSGASLAAVRDGKPVDTSMAFTPAAGFP